MRVALLDRVRATDGRPDPDLVAALCRELRAFARQEEEQAASEASGTPYWLACPPSVLGHRVAARVLRAGALRLEADARVWGTAT